MWGDCEAVQRKGPGKQENMGPRGTRGKRHSDSMSAFFRSAHVQDTCKGRSRPGKHLSSLESQPGCALGVHWETPFFLGTGQCGPVVEHMLGVCKETHPTTSPTKKKKKRPGETEQTISDCKNLRLIQSTEFKKNAWRCACKLRAGEAKTGRCASQDS